VPGGVGAEVVSGRQFGERGGVNDANQYTGFRAMDGLAQRAEVYGAYVWAYLVLTVALVTVLRSGADRLSAAEIKGTVPLS